MTEENLFAAALDKAGEERQAFLAEACTSDTLRCRLEKLLAAHDHSQGILDQRDEQYPLGMRDGAHSRPILEGPGDMIGPYKLKEQIGEGGFGLVFVAEQQQPLRRKVALKIIKPGMDTREVITRFEAERQALALMDHPHIAHVYDGGATDSGRPYFVMELVRGVAITEYCDQTQLTPHERLKIFIPVCMAVQHAHQKGIIHRDLKPSNILVTLHDSEPVVKVIDFGVAKALNQQLTDRSIYTRFAQMIGTPAYMSPEQAEMSGLDMDTRSDIYSLGVLLYELLTGTTPFESDRLKTASFDEIRRILREEDPPKPSTRISTLGMAATTVSTRRKCDPRILSQSLRGELDWIVMKALEKDRTRRYDTANDLARDIQRYLRDEPVEASPPSTWYQFQKLLRRNRGLVAAVTTITMALVLGIIGATWGMLNAQAAWKAEAHERQRAEFAEAAARVREKEVKNASKSALAVIDFLRTDLLSQASPQGQINRKSVPEPNLTVRAALDRAAQSVSTKFIEQPEVEAGIRKTIGEAYRDLAQYDKAIYQLKKAAELRDRLRGPDDNETINTWHSLALAYMDVRQTKEAIRLLEQVRDTRLRLFGLRDVQTLTAMDNLARTYLEDGRVEDARTLFKQVRMEKIDLLGMDDPSTLLTMHNLATLEMSAGKLPDAISEFEQLYEAKCRVLGVDHPDTLPTLNNLATANWKAKRYDKAIQMLEKLSKEYEKNYVANHPNILGTRANLGVVYRDSGRLAEALPLLEKAHREGKGLASLNWISYELFTAYAKAGKTAEAIALSKESIEHERKVHAAASPALAAALARIGLVLVEMKAWQQAEPLFREALTICEKEQPNHWTTFLTQARLGQALLGQQRYKEAEQHLVAGYQGMKQRQQSMSRSNLLLLKPTVDRLIKLYTEKKQPESVKNWQNEKELLAK